MSSSSSFRIGGVRIGPGETRNVRLKVSERYTGDDVTVPLRVIRAWRPGPAVFISAAVHGNEINGTGIIHELMFGEVLKVHAGTVILVPVVNPYGFETHDRYMPDGRDLNRHFPGSPRGSLARRVADILFREIVLKSDYGLDLHTAAAQRTNYPNIRAGLSDERVLALARAFGSEVIVDSEGPTGSLRRAATAAGCPTIVLEAGEPLKMQPGVLEAGILGVTNVLHWLGIVDGSPSKPDYQIEVTKRRWVRADVGGLLHYHVAPGEAVEAGQPLATSFSLYGDEQNTLTAPEDSIVIGVTTRPAVKPGEPVFHLAMTGSDGPAILALQQDQPPSSLSHRLRAQLGNDIAVVSSEDVHAHPHVHVHPHVHARRHDT